MPKTSGGEGSARLSEAGQHAGRGAHRLKDFWARVTEGLEIQELWSQIRADARASYQFYAKDIDQSEAKGEPRLKRGLRIGRALFWAMLMKLTPARRVLLLIAIALLVFPGGEVQYGNEVVFRSDTSPLHIVGGLLLFVLLALELADRVTMKRDLEIARDIQRWLMPEVPPQIPGVDIAFATRAANTVAGDYYDAFMRPAADGAGAEPSAEPAPHLLMAIADVAGKSVPAALLMATFQASLRTLAMSPSSLAVLARGLNDYACGQNIGGTRFTTAFLAELDPATHALTYVRAGHNLPVLARASGAIERLETGGLPFGIRPGTVYEAGTGTLAPGDLLVMFTDGLVEAENESGEEYGEARMLQTLAERPSAGAREMLKALMASVDGFVGPARQHDDITCMLVRTL
ncbi:MAG: serine/threonine protein phosphatase [Acidobacteria bacterium]|nr:MAG: serine/threonine protein phosphatase [Acidobacteriota bacterium]